MRGLNELMDVTDPAWPLLTERIATGSVEVVALPSDAARGADCLVRLQVTARSFLGAVALYSGGMLVDGGWLRVYGGAGTGSAGCLPDLGTVNGFPAGFEPGWLPDAGLVLAHDVLGGTFALNGHDPAATDRPGSPGEMIYFAPDSLAWEAFGVGHGDWLSWLLSEDGLAGFYTAVRWPGWREDVARLTLSEGLSAFPFLWTEQARTDPLAITRRPAPMGELLGLSRAFAEQITSVAPGALGLVPQA